MSVAEDLGRVRAVVARYPHARLVAVSKTHPTALIEEAYAAGQRLFGESRPKELAQKAATLPRDVEWHLIGHLQRNKVRDVLGVAHLIHSVDSARLLRELATQARGRGVDVNVLLQVHIAREETKFGLGDAELEEILRPETWDEAWPAGGRLRVRGLMGMATYTADREQVREEFRGLRRLFERLRAQPLPPGVEMTELSMGMSGDYALALDEGSTLVRVGTAVFGDRGHSDSPLDGLDGSGRTA